MRFLKMHGCGNDYVVVDAMTGELAERYATAPVEDAAPLARATCDRRFGVGADGFVLILPETRDGSDAHFEMRMYNPDGSYSGMCGNALRCVGKRLVESGAHPAGETLVVRSADTPVAMRTFAEEPDGSITRVEADLGSPIFTPDQVPCLLTPGAEGDLRRVMAPLGGGEVEVSVLSMGNPHCVLFLDEPADDALVTSMGPQLETHPAFPARTNVEFVAVLSPTRLMQRTWERGAGETLACGSGACAVAVAAALTGRAERELTIELLGGELDLAWRESDGHVLMTGPAVEVFAGEWPDEDAS